MSDGERQRPDGSAVWSIADLTAELRDLLAGQFGSFWVAGELSGVSRPASGHIYFDLVDRDALLKGVVWRSAAARLPAGLELRSGMAVVAHGKLDIYAPRGTYQLIADKIVPQGVGAAELALKQLLEKLFTKGYFDPLRKRRLPLYPRRVAVVTSPTGAAVRDIVQVLRQRWPAVEVVVCPARVQGAGAAEEVAAALERVSALHTSGKLRFDAAIVGRGGGSADDLAAFNAEAVADAIYRAAVPVISAVGHEIDLTVADRVADLRAVTPTEAATLLVPDRLELLSALQGQERRLLDRLRERVDRLRGRLDELRTRPAFRLPLERVHDNERKLDDWQARLKRAALAAVERQRGRLAAVAGKLESLSPLNVLGRGYSLTFVDGGPLLRDATAVAVGTRLRTRLGRGEIVSRVEEVRG